MSTITALARNNDKRNKTRSILIIISIVLTTMLLTVIATFCYGSIRSNRTNAEQLYGSFYGTYAGVTEDQIQQMKRRSEFSDIGRLALAGEAENEKKARLYWADDITCQLTNVKQYMEKGTFPEKENEIAAGISFFEALGYENPQVGEKISFNSRADSDSTYETQQFVICGLLKENLAGLTMKSYIGYVAKEFYENRTSDDKRNYRVYFRLNDTVKITSDGAEDLIKELAKKCGIDEKKVSANNGYLMWYLDPGVETIFGGVLLAGCIVLFSVAVIYNIFQVGIVQKIQEYGKLKALGATKRQVKRLVLLEGMLLSIVGVPIGLSIGCALGQWVFSWLMDQSEALRTGVELAEVSIFSLPVLGLVVAASFLTVYLALRKPMKMVAKLSSVDAMRYQENTGKKQSIRKGKKYVTVKDMTLASLSGNKKRTITTIGTMGLSCVLFVTIASFVGNINDTYEARKDVEYGQFMISLDYSLNDTAYTENNLDHILKDNPLDQDLVTKIKQLDGVTDVKTRKILAQKEMKLTESNLAGTNLTESNLTEINLAESNLTESNLTETNLTESNLVQTNVTDNILPESNVTNTESGNLSSVAVLDREDFNKLKNLGGTIGTIDYDTASKQNGMIFGWSYFIEDDGYSLNQKFQTQLDNGLLQQPFSGTVQGAFGNCDQSWAITEDTYLKLGFSEGGIGYIWVDCEPENRITLQNELRELLSDKEHVEIDTYEDALKTSQVGTRMMKLLTYTFLAIMGIIGFLNMTNTIIVNIITRKKELGVLQAIGMTKRQLNQMLQLEGLLFTVGTVLVAMVVGVPAGYALFVYGKSNSWVGLTIYHLPFWEIVIMIAIIAILQTVLSFALSRNIRKESALERIRYQE